MEFNSSLTSIAIYNSVQVFLNTLRELDKVIEIFTADYSDNEEIDGLIYSDENEYKISLIDDIINNEVLNRNLEKVRESIIEVESNISKKFLMKFIDYIFDIDGVTYSKLRKTCEDSIMLDEEEFKQHEIAFKKAYTYYITGVSEALDVKGVLKENKLPEELARYQSDYRLNVIDYFKKINNYTSNNKISVSSIVEGNKEFFTTCLTTSAEKYSLVDTDFYANCESVMFYDFELLKAGELEINEIYINRLKKRIDDPDSVYNAYETIHQIKDYLQNKGELTVENCKLLYVYEDYIDDVFITDALNGVDIKTCAEKNMFNNNGQTSHFGKR